MFKQRLLTTLVLLPLVLIVIYYAPSLVLAGILLFLVAACSWEWTKLIPCDRLEYKLGYILVVLLMIWVCSFELSIWLITGLIAWLFVLLAVVAYPRSQFYWGYPIVVGAAGLLFLSLFSNAFIQLYSRQYGQDLIVYVLCIIWATDTGAYLVGKRWGKHKLIPMVSPGKTIEGMLGGCVVALFVAVIGYFIFKPHSIAVWFLVAVLTMGISMVGDLLISLLKRRVHLKDSGHILPGHGGMLDRLDSSIAALPLFYFALSFVRFGH